MATETRVRVFSPFRGRVVDVTQEQAEILRLVKQVLDCYQSTAAERAQLATKEWKRNRDSVLDDLELFDNQVAGAASWCVSTKVHPDVQSAIAKMNQYNVEDLLQRLKAYPQLRQYVQKLGALRRLVEEQLAA